MNDEARALRLPSYVGCLGGQSALVTGASSGIGRMTARLLAQAGANVVINHLDDPAGAEELAHEISALGRQAIVLQADVGNEGQVQAMFASAIRHFGTLHIMVGNAGVQSDGAIEGMTLEQWRRVMDANLTGQFLCAREAVREFLSRGLTPLSRAAGKLICISSVHQNLAWAGHANYAASKGGLMMLMRSLAQELAPRRIRVNGIAPGAICTAINRSAWDTAEALAKLEALIPYGRAGQAEDVAQVAVWLASDASDYVTGTTLTVDGGLALNLVPCG